MSSDTHKNLIELCTTFAAHLQLSHWRVSFSFGTGYILRSSNEPFLIGTRGSPKTTRATRSAVISGELGELIQEDIWPNPMITIEATAREHSRKPDEAFRACEDLMPEARRIELFSRTDRPGWAVWGDEVGKFGGAHG